jgi:hypothetical protein
VAGPSKRWSPAAKGNLQRVSGSHHAPAGGIGSAGGGLQRASSHAPRRSGDG